MTKRMMKDALMELLEQRPLSTVSVTDLCARADVNRSTFYSYYDNLTQLLREAEDDLIAQLPSAMPIDEQSDPVRQLTEGFTLFFGYVRRHARDFDVLLRAGDPSFSERLMDTIMERFRKPDSGTENPLPKSWGYIYAVNGTIGLIREWIRGGFPIPEGEFAVLVLRMGFRANDLKSD